MKKVTHCLLTLLILGVLSGQSHALMLSMEPSSQFIQPHQSASIDLIISGLGAGGPDSLGAFSFDFLFNSDSLNYNGVVFSPYLGDIDPFAFETDIYVDDSNAAAGPQAFVHVEEVSFLFDFELDMLQGDSFTLATFSFIGAMGGDNFLSLDNIVLSDAFGFQLPDPDRKFAIIKVPEPSTMILFMMAGLVMVGLMKHQNR